MKKIFFKVLKKKWRCFQGSYGHCEHFTEEPTLLRVLEMDLCLPRLMDGQAAGSFGGHPGSAMLFMRWSWISPRGRQTRSWAVLRSELKSWLHHRDKIKEVESEGQVEQWDVGCKGESRGTGWHPSAPGPGMPLLGWEMSELSDVEQAGELVACPWVWR